MDEIISVRVDQGLREKMKAIEHINWSAVIRRILIEKVEELKEDNFDVERAKKASESADKIRKSGIFNGGKTGTEIIREWRNKRRF